jgi:hypothetical protein
MSTADRKLTLSKFEMVAFIIFPTIRNSLIATLAHIFLLPTNFHPGIKKTATLG